MKTFFVILVLIFTTTEFSFGQSRRTQQRANQILEEGILLYRLEKAAWYGTDFFRENFPHKKDFVGGYVSYINENNQVVNVFFERENPSHIIARLKFETFPQENPIGIDTLNQVATQKEMDLIAMRQDAIQRVNQNRDFFIFYENTSFNFIPLIQGKQRRVFILTAPTIPDVVLIGNDYLLTYNNRNRFTRKERIHNSLIQFQVEGEATFHSHVLSHLITSTDICTLLLYRDFVEWDKHYVISEKYVSIFCLKTKGLAVMTTKAWRQIGEHQRNR